MSDALAQQIDGNRDADDDDRGPEDAWREPAADLGPQLATKDGTGRDQPGRLPGHVGDDDEDSTTLVLALLIAPSESLRFAAW